MAPARPPKADSSSGVLANPTSENTTSRNKRRSTTRFVRTRMRMSEGFNRDGLEEQSEMSHFREGPQVDPSLDQITGSAMSLNGSVNEACWGTLGFPVDKPRSYDPNSLSYKDLKGHARLGATFHQTSNEAAKFMVVREKADPQDVLSAMEHSWGMARPGAIFSVAGGVMNLKMHTVLAQVINMGLAKAVTITDAWLVTGGVDAGVMRLLGGGLRKYGAHAPCVGILPWGRLDNAVRDKLKSAHTHKKIMPVAPADFAHQVALEPHHSHFVLVNDPAEPKEGEEAWGREIPLRLALEERLQRHWKVPRLLMAVQGSRGTFESIVQALQANCPVVVVRESGGVAEMVAKFTDTLREPHRVALSQQNPAYPRRTEVPEHLVPWSVAAPTYNPVYFVHPVVIEADCTGLLTGTTKTALQLWADPEDLDKVPDESPLAERLSYEGPIVFDSQGFPINPRGRTGMRGRGLLGKWGPNHAADPIVTRFHPQTGRLQMVAIKRRDTGLWAIPGGMVDPGEHVTATVRREFEEEAMAHGDVAEQQRMKRLLDRLFGSMHGDDENTTEESTAVARPGSPDAHGGENSAAQEDADAHELATRAEDNLMQRLVYRGYVDDPRNTDNAWMESVAVLFHCEPELASALNLVAGSDASKVQWLDVDLANADYANLYASHRVWVDQVARHLGLTAAEHERKFAPGVSRHMQLISPEVHAFAGRLEKNLLHTQAEKEELPDLLQKLHIVGTHRQLVTVFSSPKEKGDGTGGESSLAVAEEKAQRFCDDLLHSIIQSYRLNRAQREALDKHKEAVKKAKKEARERKALAASLQTPTEVEMSAAALAASAGCTSEADARAIAAACERCESRSVDHRAAQKKVSGSQDKGRKKPSFDLGPATGAGGAAGSGGGGSGGGGGGGKGRDGAEGGAASACSSGGAGSSGGGGSGASSVLVGREATSHWQRDLASTYSCLLQLVVRWGRADLAMQVLVEPELGAERSTRKLRAGLQEALSNGFEDMVEMMLSHADEQRTLPDREPLDASKLASQIDFAALFRAAPRQRRQENNWAHGYGIHDRRDEGDAFGLFRELQQYEKRQEEQGGRRIEYNSTGTHALHKEDKTAAWRSVTRARRMSMMMGVSEAHLLPPWLVLMRELVDGYEVVTRPSRQGQQLVVRLLDLFLWAVAAGRPHMVQTLWRRSSSPIRVALIAKEMCQRIRRHAKRTLAVAQTRERLELIEADCQRWLLGTLDNVRHVHSARRILLEKHARLGMRGQRSGNLLELGINLHDQAFVGHPWCQSILDEQWCGRDARCGKVMFKHMPKTVPLVMQVLFGWSGLQFIELEPNPEVAPIELSDSHRFTRKLATDLHGAQKEMAARLREQEDLPVWQQVMHVYQIPAAKHMLGIITSTVQSALLVDVALRDNMRSQLSYTDVVLCFWLLSPLLQLLVEDHDLRGFRFVAETFVLLLLVAACALRVLLATPAPWWRVENVFGSEEATDAAEDACKLLMALSAVMQSLKLLQRFFVHKHVGVLITAVYEMVLAVGRLLGIFLVVTLGCSVAFEVLLSPSDDHAAALQAEAASGELSPSEILANTSLLERRGTGHSILYEDDPDAFQRWSIPWFAIYGHISQNPIHEYTGSALLAPFLLWLYMLMAQIGMLNLLIAVMTDTYFKVGDKNGVASASWRMSRVATNLAYIQRSSVPAPFDLPLLLFRLIYNIVVTPIVLVRRCFGYYESDDDEDGGSVLADPALRPRRLSHSSDASCSSARCVPEAPTFREPRPWVHPDAPCRPRNGYAHSHAACFVWPDERRDREGRAEPGVGGDREGRAEPGVGGARRPVGQAEAQVLEGRATRDAHARAARCEAVGVGRNSLAAEREGVHRGAARARRVPAHGARARAGAGRRLGVGHAHRSAAADGGHAARRVLERPQAARRAPHGGARPAGWHAERQRGQPPPRAKARSAAG